MAEVCRMEVFRQLWVAGLCLTATLSEKPPLAHGLQGPTVTILRGRVCAAHLTDLGLPRVSNWMNKRMDSCISRRLRIQVGEHMDPQTDG